MEVPVSSTTDTKSVVAMYIYSSFRYLFSLVLFFSIFLFLSPRFHLLCLSHSLSLFSFSLSYFLSYFLSLSLTSL